MNTRIGKIARFPLDVRNELNRRIENGEPGKALVEWLNDQPEAEMLEAYFGGRAINEQNLSDWKAGGYQDWLAQRALQAEARQWSENIEGLARVGNDRLTDHMATVLNLRYAAVLAEWDGEATDEFERKLKLMDRLRQSVVGLRRSHHQAVEVELEQWRYRDEMKKAEREREAEIATNKCFKEMMIWSEARWNKEHPDDQRHYSFLQSSETRRMKDLTPGGVKETKSLKVEEAEKEEPRTLNVDAANLPKRNASRRGKNIQQPTSNSPHPVRGGGVGKEKKPRGAKVEPTSADRKGALREGGKGWKTTNVQQRMNAEAQGMQSFSGLGT